MIATPWWAGVRGSSSSATSPRPRGSRSLASCGGRPRVATERRSDDRIDSTAIVAACRGERRGRCCPHCRSRRDVTVDQPGISWYGRPDRLVESREGRCSTAWPRSHDTARSPAGSINTTSDSPDPYRSTTVPDQPRCPLSRATAPFAERRTPTTDSAYAEQLGGRSISSLGGRASRRRIDSSPDVHQVGQRRIAAPGITGTPTGAPSCQLSYFRVCAQYAVYRPQQRRVKAQRDSQLSCRGDVC